MSHTMAARFSSDTSQFHSSASMSSSWHLPTWGGKGLDGAAADAHSEGERGGFKMHHLVPGQGDERADHDGEAARIPHKRGKLEAERFARARGQYDERVPPLKRRCYRLQLARPEGRVAVVIRQHLFQLRGRLHRARHRRESHCMV